MSRPSKPMSKNSNSKFTPRNNKQAIFARISEKSVKQKDSSEEKVNESKEDK